MTEQITYAYLITNTTNGKCYVGISKDFENRWSGHKCAAEKGRGHALHAAMRRYGPEKFSFEIVACARSYQDLRDLERILIAQHGTYIRLGRGYNMTLGGDGVFGHTHSEITRAKMRVARASFVMPPHSAEHNAKIATALLGKKHPPERRANMARAAEIWKHTEEFKKRVAVLSEQNRVRPVSVETREKLRQTHLGKKKTDKAKKNMSAAAKLRSSTPEFKAAASRIHKGKILSDETKAKIRATKAASRIKMAA